MLSSGGGTLLGNRHQGETQVSWLSAGLPSASHWLDPPTPAVCTPCRLGWAFFQDRCYFYSTSLSAWDMANTSCAAQGAQLLTMDSPAEQVSWGWNIS